MSVHELKVWPEYFQAIIDGNKPFEARKNDRDFHLGDLLILKEYQPSLSEDPDPGYTNRQAKAKVTYILQGEYFGIKKGYVVMGLDVIEYKPGRR